MAHKQGVPTGAKALQALPLRKVAWGAAVLESSRGSGLSEARKVNK